MDGNETYEELEAVVEKVLADNIKLREELDERDETRAELREMYEAMKINFEQDSAYRTMQDEAYNEA